MSSTQHQLIEQCATRLRGIVEALDNIHDSTPHRWSTDLDEVHSSAESLLAMIKDQAPARSETSFEEWLANELEGEDGQPVPAAVCDIALARRAFNHWPKLEQPAKVGGVRFSAGVSSRLVVEAAQRLYEFESTPEKEAERIERLQAFREQLDPLNLAPHAEAFNEAPDEAIRPEQAEAERPEVVAFRYRCTNAEGEPLPGWFYSDDAGTLGLREPLTTVAECDRIVGALRYKAELYDEVWALVTGKGYVNVTTAIAKLEQERDAVLARVAELERQEPVAWMHDQPNRVDVIHRDVKDLLQRVPGSNRGIHRPLDVSEHYTIPLYAAPVAQAQQLNDLDKQCRDDVARALGLRPNQERGFAWSYLLASIKSCVKASGDSAQAQHSVPDGWVQSLPLKDHQPCKSNEDRANGYVIPIYSRPVPVEEALRKLRAVLCDPVGNVVIDGSDGDREEVQRALGMLAAAPAQGGE
ncbi:TPA: hypothetical protein NH769_001662 [Pseudomonas aeruginosa]|uniref:hypothetical protein n=1 Tax=Pseudomonas aeruginosa TaxID=287 RepID=UPI000FC3F898|nr:hypothetical protein [Pseudomonas aeruginosa]MBI8762162.1 hypothetical protein [Pseudomonas aeruginosa]RUD01263.1 hypothetical protein IPC1377_26225 [Pseudomonas aeruginosa]HCF1060871.1 hypothetical protein [Pseudomonas aeruginosa]HEJ3740810.1 hypothetical protein [Pseudomonas aeruginosa]HEK0855049.1 hypothetical protein [Pseudomonas aeruginosa]